MAGFTGRVRSPNATTSFAAQRNPLTSDYIVSGPTTTLNGVTNFAPFSSSSALDLTLTGAVTNIVMMIAGKRYAISGALVVALTDAAWNFVYYDADTAALGTVTVAPRYWWEAPAHLAGQHWFDMSTGLMKLSDGVSAWTAKNRIFLGCWRADTTINAAYSGAQIGRTVEQRVHDFGSGTDGMLDTNNTNTAIATLKKYSFIGQRGTSSLVHTAALLTGAPIVQCQQFMMNLGTGGIVLDGLGLAGCAGGASANGGAGGSAGWGGAGGGGGGSSGQTGGAGGTVQNANRIGTSAGGTAGASSGGAGANGQACEGPVSLGQGNGGVWPPWFWGGGGGGGGSGATGAAGGAGGGGIDIAAESVCMASTAIATCLGSAGTAGPAADR